MGDCVALIVAAGRGQRLGGEVPKQYRPLAGRPLLRHCAAAFVDHPRIERVQVVYHPDDAALYDRAVGDLGLLPPVPGGATRQASVLEGLEALAASGSADGPERVLIHDAARPFVSTRVIDAAIDALDGHSGALVAVPVVDTLKRADGGIVVATLDRAELWRAQTPQAFRFEAILAAHRAAAGQALTDDAAVAEAAGLDIILVPGEEENFKVTTEDDLARAEALAAARDLPPTALPHVGTGFDVHGFGPGDHVWLCGVRIDHDRGLAGHSDADAGLHALTDAILGAIAAGDIGQHFSDRDPQWQGASSDRFLRHAVGLVAARGGRLVHLDVTLICERPKIGPHRAAMRARVAEICELPESAVSVKATTTEKLGFVGRGEGIGAQAIATVLVPESR